MLLSELLSLVPIARSWVGDLFCFLHEAVMKGQFAVTFAVLAVAIGMTSPVFGESLKDKVVGAWTLEAGSENFPDGRKLTPVGNRKSDP